MSKIQDELCQAFSFSDKELAANQEGFLSTHQSKKLRKELLQWYLIALPLYLLALGIFVDMALRLAKPEANLQIPTFPFFGLLLVAFPIFLISYYLRLTKNPIRSIEGEVTTYENTVQTKRGKVTSRQNKIQIDSKSGQVLDFFVPYQVETLKRRKLWRIYYNPQLKILLSIEPVEENTEFWEP